MVIQEPHINFLHNTSANHHWHVLYPTQHYTHPQQWTRAVILVSASLDTNMWKQISFPSSDVIILQLSGPYGRCTIFNIYNDGNSQTMLTAIDSFLEHNIDSIKTADNDHMIWLGDFNRHHPTWEDIRNRHLFNYAAAQPLIDLIADYGMLQLLPGGIPTLQSTSTGNWTRPDNVFGTEQLLDAVVSCEMAPELCGPKTDHVPILLTLELEIPRVDLEPRRNWREVDWEAFNSHLSTRISTSPALPLASNDEFQAAARHFTQAVTDTIEAYVPYSRPCPHSKRWWTRQLTKLQDQVKVLSKLAYQMRGLPLHACHEELTAARRQYADEIMSTKKQHWVDWLKDIEGNDLWTAN